MKMKVLRTPSRFQSGFRKGGGRAPLGALHTRLARRGFTLIEVLVAAALLGASLVVMFGFHSQAVRANMNARRMTDCTYLAQTQMERLQSVDWNSAVSSTSLSPGSMTDAEAMSMTDDLEWPLPASDVNAANDTNADLGPVMYRVTWDVENMDSDETWVRLRVRCTYPDSVMDSWHGTTISGYRYKDW